MQMTDLKVFFKQMTMNHTANNYRKIEFMILSNMKDPNISQQVCLVLLHYDQLVYCLLIHSFICLFNMQTEVISQDVSVADFCC